MLAASQAFQANQGGQTKLATGAAAAALRSMSPASKPVSQVQTKRMTERQNSIGSQNAQRGRSRGNNMHRRSSSSSMTERIGSFRENSPGRPSTSNGAPPQRREEPPVPRLPDNYNYNNIPPVPPKSSRRSASIDDIQIRKNAAARQNQNRHSSVEPTRQRAVEPAKQQAGANPGLAAARRVTSGSAAPQLDRTDSNNSVNFSYPNRARPTSPPPQSPTFKQAAPMSTPKTASKAAARTTPDATPQSPPKGISEVEARNIQYELSKTAQQPVKKNKKRQGPLAEGSHLQTGTMGQKPLVTSLAPGPSIYDEATLDTPDRGQNNARLSGEASHFPPSPISPTDSQGSVSDSDRNQSRRNQRASGSLQKQPSVVREDWEGEQEEQPSSPIQPSPAATVSAPSKRQNAEANVSRKIEGANAKYEQEQPESAVPRNLKTPEPRKPSLSPSRSARFSNRLSADMAAGQKHEPPPRSVSPRKGALKHTSSPIILAADTNRPRDSSLSPSEGIDISTGAIAQPKKSAHVKFDTHPAVAIAAEPMTPDSDQIVSPQYREKDKKWFGLRNKPQNRVVLSEDSDDEDAMKPRPVLPTFGSVRGGRKNDTESTPSQKMAPSPSASSTSSLSSGVAPATMETSVSSDRAIGGLLSNESLAKNPNTYATLTPEATSTEGSGMHSDTDSVYSQTHEDDTLSGSQQQGVPAPAMAHDVQNTEYTRDHANLPSIAVQPATPGVEEESKHNDQWLVEVPGGFPAASHETSGSSTTPPSTSPQVTATRASSSYDAVTMPQLESSATSSGYHSAYDTEEHRQERMPSIQEEDSDKDSIYSDAAEDMSDLEGDGFGSINAIVRSPAVASPEASSTPPQSPAAPAPYRDIEQNSEREGADWDAAGARWKEHVENVKRASLQPAAPIAEKSTVPTIPKTSAPAADKPIPETSTVPVTQKARAPAVEKAVPKVAKRTEPKALDDWRPKKSASPIATNTAMSPAASPSPAENTTARRDNNQTSFRKSMRTEGNSSGPTLRNANQNPQVNEGPKTMRASMRAGAVAAAAPAPRPAGANVPQAQGTLQKKSLRAGAPAPQQKSLPPVNNDSDSESSFRRRRRNRASNSSKHAFRSSMRATGAEGTTSTGPDRRDVRSMSPVERRPFSPVGGQSTMRTTMRGSIDKAPSMRPQPTERRSSSLFGRRKEAKSPSVPMPVATTSKPRVADSDDEGDAQPRKFRSRFGDSSDEEDDLRPVRGIPRNNRDDDSTDLDDSSDDEAKKGRKENKQKNLAAAVAPAMSQPERPMSPSSPDGKKKRGFFGRLKKSKDEPASPGVQETMPVVNGNRNTTSSTSKDAETAGLGFKSDAEKEALIEQTRLKLEAAREPPASASPVQGPARPMSPSPGKLQRRHTPQRVMSDSWPLPPKIPDDEPTTPDRPFTSDGPAVGDRSGLEGPNSSALSSPVSSKDNLSKGGKKKKFPMLRKAFGLKD